MSANLKVIENDQQFQQEWSNAGSKLVVVDFFATWCGPCRTIAPLFEQLARTHPRALFLKVDVEKCQATAATHSVTAMPTFIFFRNKTKVDSLQGADAAALEEKVKKWDVADEGEEESGVKGHMDLSSFITKTGCECLNESDDHPLEHCLTSKPGFLESDCDEELIIALAFNQPVKLHSLKIYGPPDKGPKTIKLFINQPNTMDFDKAAAATPTQQLDLTEEDIKEGSLNALKYVKFQAVQNITIFVKDNQGGEETTVIDYLSFIGSPINSTNMSDFKRVAGKKGESH